MNSSTTATPSAGTALHGFRIDSVTPAPDLRAEVIRGTHLKTGAQVLHVWVPEDSENCFALCFSTPPSDDTGVPHIVEHAVLAGSEKYPLREPFFEMLKLSPASFINAMTWPDRTIYPACSTVEADFYNIFDVYLDAVFHPLISRDTFEREGHHLRFEDPANPASPLKIGGIVYNEMKGTNVFPQRVIDLAESAELFCDTPNRHDAGGGPRHIPTLTYAQFDDFYRRHYNAANAHAFFYGSLPTGGHLQRLGEALDRLAPGERTPPLPYQPRWPQSRRTRVPYAITPEESPAGRTYLSLIWIMGDALNPQTVLDGMVLSAVLMGNDAAPLKSDLIDSKLGSDTFEGMGVWDERRPDGIFRVVIRGSEADRADAFEKLVLDTLAGLADAPLPENLLASAVNQVSHGLLDVGRFYPLAILNRVLPAWMNGRDPLCFLSPRTAVEQARARYADDPMYFPKLIRSALLENPHRVLAILEGDPALQAREEAELAEKLARTRAALSAEEVSAIATRAAALAAAQDVPNPPEAIALLPQIQVSEMPVRLQNFPCEVTSLAGATLLRNEVFANGINHLELAIDLAGLAPELYRWLPIYVEAVQKMGAGGEDYLSTARRRAAFTGQLRAEAHAQESASGTGLPIRGLHIGLNALDAQMDGALTLLGDLIFTLDPTDHARLREVVIQFRESLRSNLLAGSITTTTLCARRLHSPAAGLDYLFRGPETLRLVEHLANDFESQADEATRSLLRIREHLAASARWTASFTGGPAGFQSLATTMEGWRSGCTPITGPDLLPEGILSGPSVRDGLAGATQVAACCKVLAAPPLSSHAAPLLSLGCHLATFDYLLPQIRLKGNAYGANAGYDDACRTIAQWSYQDPNIAPTLAVFDELAADFAARQLTQTELNRAIIRCAADTVAPVRPSRATAKSLERHLRGITPELRQSQHEALLAATPGAVKDAFLGILESGEPQAGFCVLGSREKLEEANAALPPTRTLIIRDLLPS